MNTEQALQVGPVITAFGNGKAIQCRDKGSEAWRDITGSCWFSDEAIGTQDFRIKPEPKFRAWKPDEVPLGIWFKSANTDFAISRWNLICVMHEGLYMGTGNTIKQLHSFDEVLESFLYSSDFGKTWHPCGVEDAS